jgi:hypothetical protein
MQRKYLVVGCVVVVLALGAALWQFNRGHADDGDPVIGKLANSALPISQVQKMQKDYDGYVTTLTVQ